MQTVTFSFQEPFSSHTEIETCSRPVKMEELSSMAMSTRARLDLSFTTTSLLILHEFCVDLLGVNPTVVGD